MAIINVNTSELPTSDAFPRGIYSYIIEEVSDPETDKNGNQYLKVRHKVTEGDSTNRVVHDNYLKLDGARFENLVAAAGHEGDTIKDTNDMVGWEFKAMTGVEPAKDGFPERNRIEMYIRAEKAAPKAAAGRGRR